ncbi:carboxylesterase BioH [Candidatus Termititenax aidoneus]|uniref:Carboxylesterase BioH n=1 Tax=Termititenax aidoneus TaxID=2218524 RepID=A0A388TCD3_TERA1|nr:carboxylesterase BioH [Candidatus Termititenax aidoneus]
MIFTRVPKQPLIFIPGWNVRAEFLQNFAENFADYELYYFTPPPVTNGDAYQQAAGALQKFIEKKKITAPVLLGWSMGGQIALLYSEIYTPGNAVVLVNSAAVFSRDTEAQKSFHLACQRNFHGAARHFLRLMENSPDENLLLQKYFIDDKASALNYLRALQAADLTAVVRNSRYPLGILHACADKIIPFTEAEYLRNLRPDAAWQKIAGAKHCPFFSHCDKITNLLDEVAHG